MLERRRRETDRTTASARIPVLDGLRGVAILLVLLRHAVDALSPATGLERLIYQLGRMGSNGVDVFFVLSGFLITGILLDTRGRPHYFKYFYVRRTLRIFPLYYAALAALFLLGPRLVDPPTTPFLLDAGATQLWYWTYMSNWLFAGRGYYGGLGHFWSLAVEEQYYLLWPVVVRLAGPRYMARVCVSLVGAAVVARIVCALLRVSTLAIYVMTITRLDGLAIGSLLAVISRRPQGLSRFARWYAPTFWASLATLALVVGMRWGEGRTLLVMLAGALPVALAGGAVLAVSLVRPPENHLVSFLSSRPLRFFGKYSYCLYIAHPMVYAGVSRVWGDDRLPAIGGSSLLGWLAFTSIAVSAAVAVALVSWHVWERRWLQLKDRFC